MTSGNYRANKITWCSFLLLLSLLSSLTIPVFGEETAIWTKTYGGTNNDDCFSVLESNDGGYILAGDTASFGAGETDILLVKTDVNGNMQWNKTYGGAASDDVQFMIPDDTGYVIAGRTYSFGAGDADLWFIKIDFDGNMLWNRTYGGPQKEWCWSIVKTSDAGFALLGRTDSFGAGSNDFWLVKTDSEGLLEWNKTIGNTGDERGRFLINTTDGGFLLLGWTNSSGAVGIDYWLVKTDSYGNLQWHKTYGGEGADRGKIIIETEDNGYLLGGSSNSFGAGNSDIWLLRIDSLGNQIWNRTYGGPESETLSSILGTADGGFTSVGVTYSFGVGDQDVWLLKIDSTGNLDWSQTYGGLAYDSANSIFVTSEGDYLLGGSSASYGLGDNDVFFIKVDGQSVIPEFSSLVILIIFITVTTVVIFSRKKKYFNT